jgi:hypothetical protein
MSEFRSFVVIRCYEGQRECYVSCSRDNLRFFPKANANKNMNKLRIDFRDVHDTLIANGFKIVSVSGESNNMTHFYGKE